jgi:predicted aconitase
MITIEINNSGSAFDEPREEIARILRELAVQIEAGNTPYFLRDFNGNRCGTVQMKLEN